MTEIMAYIRERITVDPETGCWNWAALKTNNYARFWFEGRQYSGHRAAYEATNGPIPARLHIDHLCRNRRCVNPDHLEAVTSAENALRGVGPTAQNATKTHCPKGHEYTPENTYVMPKGAGRGCKACRATASRRRSLMERLKLKRRVREAEASVSSLEAQLLMAREALEPFAAEFGRRDHLKPGPDIDYWPIGGSALTLGDLRRASEAHARLSGGSGGSSVAQSGGSPPAAAKSDGWSEAIRASEGGEP